MRELLIAAFCIFKVQQSQRLVKIKYICLGADPNKMNMNLA